MGDASKRLRPDDAPELDPGAKDFVDRSTLDELLAEWKEAVATSVGSSTQELLRKYDASSQKRLASIEGSMHSLRANQDQVSNEQKKMREDLDKIKAQLLIAENASGIRDAIDNDNFDREIDPTIIKINSRKPVGHEFLKKAASDWLDPSFADLYKVQGETAELIKSITVQFKGIPVVAAKHVDRALRSLRRDDGSWTQLTAKDEAGESVNIYAGPDKSSKQVRTEIDSKKLHTIFQQLYPGTKFHLLRRDGVISVNFKKLARVVPQPDKETIIEWDFDTASSVSIDKIVVSGDFRNISDGSKTDWKRI